MIRSFPKGFRYPIPRGWPYTERFCHEPEALPWIDDDENEKVQERIRNQWRGFRILLDVLVQKQHDISELILDVHRLNTGLNYHIFDQPCDEYHNFATLLRRPGFRRLDLSLLVGGMEHDDSQSFRQGLLREALAGARDLEHFQFHTNVEIDFDVESTNPDGTHRNEIPLRNIFPIDQWSNLRHFGLSAFMVAQDDLVSLLSQLPTTLRSVELSFLLFFSNKGDYRSLLYDIRDKLDWRNRVPGERPKLIVGFHVSHTQTFQGRTMWLSKEAGAFVYSNGPNPFGQEDGSNPYMVYYGPGIERDEFEPAHERPHVHFEELLRLGIIRSVR